MGCIRPATPGFIVTLVATILLAVVSFCVPYFKSIFFLKANVNTNGVNGFITFGTLGYCVTFGGNATCSSPSIGYELGQYFLQGPSSPLISWPIIDINGLLDLPLGIEIPQVAVKWLTYALFLHVVALILSAGSALFGLLAHVREMSMTCCSTFISGLAAGITLLAFIFDLVLFFVARARINAVGSAEIGNAIWLTLAAWALLFFSSCFYTLGRCCISKRPSWKKPDREAGSSPQHSNAKGTDEDRYAEQMRMDAVRAEEDRKARQKQHDQKEQGLPAFHETQPLTARIEGEHVYVDEPYSDRPQNEPTYPGGYVKPQQSQSNNYPPPPRRQGSAFAPTTYAPSTYTPPAAPISGPGRTVSPQQSQYMGAQEPYGNQYQTSAYGHAAVASSCKCSFL